jgi:Protein of unknown function (DUF1769)
MVSRFQRRTSAPANINHFTATAAQNEASSTASASTTTTATASMLKPKSPSKGRKFVFFRKAGEPSAGLSPHHHPPDREETNSTGNSETPSSSLETQVIATATSPAPVSKKRNAEKVEKSSSREQDKDLPACGAFPFGNMCGNRSAADTALEDTATAMLNKSDDSEDSVFDHFPDDPTIQESIECVLANRGLLLSRYDKNDEDCYLDGPSKLPLQTPSSLQQCLLKNRCTSHLPVQFQHEAMLRSPTYAPAAYHHCHHSTLSLLDARTFDSALAEAEAQVEATATHTTEGTCSCRHRQRPILEPEHWPQRPLLMRPSPFGGTVIVGVRFSASKEYLWKAHTNLPAWPDALRQHWKKKSHNALLDDPTTSCCHMCQHCMILPINNGKEMPGQSLVTDFESEFFEGTILVRLKDSKGTTCPENEQEDGYFSGLHRRYQVVIRGKFKQAIPWTECFAGFQYVFCTSVLTLCGNPKYLTAFFSFVQYADLSDPPASFHQSGS